MRSGAQMGAKLAPLKCRDGSRPNILLAEDSPAARVLTGALLNRIGCDVDVAEHGEEALTYIQSSCYDLVLMDIEMPVMDGVVAAREIRTMGGRVAKTPIVALSAFLADTKKSSHWQHHFDVALSKPAGKQQLHATIGKVLDFDPANSKWSKSAYKISGDQNNQNDALAEEEKLERVLLNISLDDQIILLQTVSTEITKYSEELVKHHRCSDIEGMRVSLHKLCGLSANFAAIRLHKNVVDLRSDISSLNKLEMQEAVQKLTVCADQTATYLLAKSQTLPELDN